MNASVEIYRFHDKREHGVFPVYDVNERLVAQIEPSFWTRKFTALHADGSVLCEGKAVPMTRAVDVIGPSGAQLLTMTSAFWSGKKRTITLAGGAAYALRGDPWPSRDWEVTDGAGRVVIGIVATASSWSFHPDAYAVQVSDPALTLAHLVGIVQSNRMLVKSARASAG